MIFEDFIIKQIKWNTGKEEERKKLKKKKERRRRKKKMKAVEIILITILCLGVASAITIYSGDSYSFESEEFAYYTVVGNSSDMEGMNISWEDGNIIINFSKYFAPDSFTIVFFNKEKEIITEHHYSSGDSSCSSCDSETEYIEVDNYIDRVVYEDREIKGEEPKEIDTPKRSMKTIWIVLLIILGLAVIFGVIVYFRNRR